MAVRAGTDADRGELDGMPYAAVIVISCAVGLTFSVSPMFFSTIPVFLKPLVGEFGWGRTQVVAGLSIGTLAVALSAPFFGRLIDRFGPRRLILVSTVLLSIAIALMGAIPDSYAAYLAGAAVIGFTGTGTNTFVYLAVLPRWFDGRLGTSLGFAMIGVGLGQAIGPIYANWLISAMGWRGAYAALGLTVLVITVSNASFILRDRPSRTEDGPRSIVVDAEGMTFAEAARCLVFWRLIAAFCLITVAITGIAAHVVPILTDRGMSPAAAAGTAGLTGVAVLVGRFATGILLDHVSASLLGIVSFLGTAAGILLLRTGLPGWPVVAAVLLCGTALGVEGDLTAYIVRRTFGMKSFGVIYGVLFGAFNLDAVIGPLLMGASFDLTGSYDPGMKALIAPALVSALLMIRVLPPRRPLMAA